MSYRAGEPILNCLKPRATTLSTKANMFAFIELNPVRAGLYDDPKDYRYCGYAEALAKGSLLARQGIRTILGQPPLTGAGGDARRTFFLLRGSRSPSSPLLCDLSLFRYFLRPVPFQILRVYQTTLYF
jgi:hypothetical protein